MFGCSSCDVVELRLAPCEEILSFSVCPAQLVFSCWMCSELVSNDRGQPCWNAVVTVM